MLGSLFVKAGVLVASASVWNLTTKRTTLPLIPGTRCVTFPFTFNPTCASIAVILRASCRPPAESLLQIFDYRSIPSGTENRAEYNAKAIGISVIVACSVLAIGRKRAAVAAATTAMIVLSAPILAIPF